MTDEEDTAPRACVIPIAGRVRRTPKGPHRAPAPPEDDESDASLLVCLEAQDLERAIATAESEVAGGNHEEVDTLAELRNRVALRTFLRGDHAAAVAAWQAVIDEDPRLTNALELRSIYLEDIGDFAGSLADRTHQIRLWPRSAELYLSRGIFFLRRDEHARACPDFERAAQLGRGGNDAYAWLARGLHGLGDLSGAIRAYGRALALSPWRADLYEGRASMLFLQGSRDEAVRDLNRCLDRDPVNAGALRIRANLHPFPEGVDLQLADLNRLLAIEPADAAALEGRARCHATRGDHALALADLTRALAVDVEDPATLLRARIDANLALGAEDDALADMTALSALGSELDAEHYLRRAEIHRARGDLARSGADYRKAVGIDEDLYGERVASMERHRDLGHLAAQREDLEILLLMSPRDADLLSARATIHAEAEAYAEALADLDRAIEGAPYRADLFHQRADVRSAAGDYDEAVEDESRAIELDPDEAEYLGWRGINRALGNGPSPEAEADVDLAVALDPADATPHLLRAWYLELDDRGEEAQKEYARLRELFPTLDLRCFEESLTSCRCG